jgi:hypothetical protein
MNIKNMIEALQICAKYHDPEKEWCSAEHDQIFFPLAEDEPSKEDAARLRELGADIEYDSWMTYV